ncbi:hypothetical protein [Bergeyella zoohelcum]|uniref:Uncharacterized protein n=1 Tax=Bergeyella zoohelcum TaxID=1015 RepID=A0A380ZUA3_9FLAO|nr:hypothetical protein [Bergeyella zoohelcum]EKB61687.1 hypothetical protein HMPREF9700_00049 [Bergeyella zoohelcum CCUG 30536]SUV52358.1 Uncharacterised protein [Bergeyella zoohelcum]
MKKTIILSAICLAQSVFSQIAIGGKGSVSSASVSIEFNDNDADRSNNKRGLVLPWVTSVQAVENGATAAGRTLVNGTLIFDTSDKKVKLKKPTGWEDLTLSTSGIVDTSLQDNRTEDPKAKVSVGTTQSNVDGILVLEDNNKAMMLPIVNSYEDIISPEPGTMVFDFPKHLLCFYNGKEWTFWAPSR